ncbi:hypothetical protein HYW67_03195 [Candidatus Parcubacteria bacterium]|nr:hypothetical protein [Candidatus Parcubacteria bacterium]
MNEKRVVYEAEFSSSNRVETRELIAVEEGLFREKGWPYTTLSSSGEITIASPFDGKTENYRLDELPPFEGAYRCFFSSELAAEAVLRGIAIGYFNGRRNGEHNAHAEFYAAAERAARSLVTFILHREEYFVPVPEESKARPCNCGAPDAMAPHERTPNCG